MSDESDSVEQQDAADAANDIADGADEVEDAAQDVASTVQDELAAGGGESWAAGEGGGIDLRLIVLLVVLMPFVIAMILGLLERFKAGQETPEDVLSALGDLGEVDVSAADGEVTE
jgi:hypothetical protein